MTWETLVAVAAQNAPATVVLAFVAWRLDQRLAVLSGALQATLGQLAAAAIR